MNKLLSNTNFKELSNARIKPLFPMILGNIEAGKSFEETEMNQSYTVNINSVGYAFYDEDIPERMFKSFIAATSVYLGKVKVSDPNTAVALVLTSVEGAFKFAGIVEYHKNEDSDEPGNWSYVLTLNEQDLIDLESIKEVKKYSYGDDAFKSILDKVSYDIGGIEFQHERFMFDCCSIAVDTIKQVLDSEAIANETVDIELKGYATFSVAVENDEKVFAITPSGEMKTLIKDDVLLEKK